MSGVFTLSIDVEGLWGLFFVRSYVEDPSAARAGRAALPRMLDLLTERDLRATFAFVGHLLLERCGPWEGAPHPEMPRPSYGWYEHDWYGDDPGTDEARDPLWYARSQAVACAAAGQDVGLHGFAHVIMDESCVAPQVAAAEFRAAREAAAAAGLPEAGSFVFPQNVVGHLTGLRAAGFSCYRRSDAGRPARAGPPGGLGRARSLVRHALAETPWVGSPVVHEDGLVAIPSSFPLLGREGLRRAVTRKARVARARKGIDLAARHGAVLHLWTHPHAFAGEDAWGDLAAILDQVAARRDAGDVEVLAMDALARRAREGA